MKKTALVAAIAVLAAAPVAAAPVALTDAQMAKVVAGDVGLGHETADHQTSNVDHAHFGLVENATSKAGMCVGNGTNTGSAAGCLD